MHSLELLKKNKIFKFDDLRQKDTGRRYMHVDLESPGRRNRCFFYNYLISIWLKRPKD